MFLRYKFTNIYNTFNIVIMLLLSSLTSPFSLAQITLDGTLGRSGTLLGSDYQITADLGQQHGGNLFHSFERFDLRLGESATFSGPNSISNIIGRVTGGNPSHINGLLRSQIPDADLYLLNPAGIFFGQDAQLDVQGSFHASTADTLRFEDRSEFNARQPQQSLLTVARPHAFGFLTDTPAAITVQESTLSVAEGQTLSLIGGDLRMSGIHSFDLVEKKETFSSELLVNSGRLNLASLASRGEVIPTEGGLNLNAQAQGGLITLDGTKIEVQEGEQIFIRGGRFELTSSQIKSETSGNKDGGVIDIQVDQLKLQNVSLFSTNTSSSGKGGDILIKVVDTLSISDAPSGIYADSLSQEINAGNAGNIEIEAGQITLTQGGQISSATQGPGASGSIIIKVADALTVSGSKGKILPSGIFSRSHSDKANAGQAGKIEIEAQKIILTELGQISSDTFGPGAGGSIVIKVADTLSIFGSGEYEEIEGGIMSSSRSKKENAGQAGSIKVEARQITLADGAVISNVTIGPKEGNSIILFVTDTLTIQSSILGTSKRLKIGGKAGNIKIAARQIFLTEGGQIGSGTFGPEKGGSIVIKVADGLIVSGHNEFASSGIFSHSESEEANAGNAGNIEIEARQITLTDEGFISSDTVGSGDGGSIVIKVADALTLSGFLSFISTGSLNQKINNAGNAGKIKIEARQIMLTDKAFINAGTVGVGEGGSIVLFVTDALTIQSRSTISSNSLHSGKAGEMEINARQLTLTEAGQINSYTSGSGEGGSIVIKVADVLTLSGHDETASSGISSSSESTKANTGQAGKIEIDARQLTLTDGAQITSTTRGSGQGGTIIIKVDETLTVSGIVEELPVVVVRSGIFTGSYNEEAYAGNAGNIEVPKAHTINLTEGGVITTQAFNASGGNITVTTPSLLYLQKGNILTNVKGGKGNGGNINIDQAHLTVLDNSEIIAQADEGKGGNISIQADQYIQSADSVVDASSKLGIDGKILIEAPDSNIGEQLVALPKTFSNPSLPEPCVTQLRNEEESSRFVRVNRIGRRRDELSGGVLGSYLDISTKH